jgi:hypothetical protein
MLKRRHVLAAGVGGAALFAAYRYSLPAAVAADERFKSRIPPRNGGRS